MKLIKCRKCKKKKQVDDNYKFKTCPICRTKEKSKRLIDREAKKLLESYKIDRNTLPRNLWSFSAFVKEFKTLWNKKPSFDDYRKEIEKFKKSQIWKEADSEIFKRKVMFETKRRELREFLRFDLFEPTNRESCKKYRYMQLGLFQKELKFMDNHIFECESCQDFDYNLKNGTLTDLYGHVFSYPKQEPTWRTATPCDKFRYMVLGKLKRDSIFMAKHHLSCKSCLEWYAQQKKKLKLSGANLW